ncbi:hypothetical protein EDB85DRAFT_1990137 [Lactarius pseudohatsudake]|nr:hypothetical protein EDB85DRAFT_1990137 [Lactarius pseudohatsudake]
MVVVLSVLAIATKLVQRGELSECGSVRAFPISQRTTESLAEKLLGSGEIGAVLQRLNRLTQDDARMAAAHILDVVHGLVCNMKVAISDGELSFSAIRPALAMMQETVDTVNNVTRVGIIKLQRTQLWRAWLPPLLTRSKL